MFRMPATVQPRRTASRRKAPNVTPSMSARARASTSGSCSLVIVINLLGARAGGRPGPARRLVRHALSVLLAPALGIGAKLLGVRGMLRRPPPARGLAAACRGCDASEGDVLVRVPNAQRDHQPAVDAAARLLVG